MPIDVSEVRRVAELARLEIADEALPRVAAQLSSVLEFVARLDALDLSGCEPASFAPADGPPRADAPDGRQLEPGEATAGAPEAEDGFFLVPPVVENLDP